jgi:hypothetical protein
MTSFPITRSPLFRIALNHLQQSRRVSPNQLIDLATVLVQDEGGHGTNAQLLRQVRQRIDVKLNKVDSLAERGLIGQSKWGY